MPVALATILAALLLPAVDFLDRRGAPRGGAVALVLLSGIAVVGGLLTFVVTQFVEGAPALVEPGDREHRGRGQLAARTGRCTSAAAADRPGPRSRPSRRCRTTRRS